MPPTCHDFVNDKINKKSNVIHLADGRFLNIKVVWRRTDDWVLPNGIQALLWPW